MGKEWYWVSSKSSKRAGGGRADKDSGNTLSGCMCSVFQLFDFHQFQFPSNQQHPSLKSDCFLPDSDLSIPKGAEAPRNSLELEEEEEEEEEEEPSSPITITQDQTLNIPMSIQIKTNGDTSLKSDGAPNDSSSSEISSSPSTKTPNLVARLMGLDLLPDQIYSPTFSSPNPIGKSHLGRRQSLQNKLSNEFSGTCSLPETPRISSARRSDVEHRLSFQINKENLSPNGQLVLTRISSLKRKELKTEDENRSPGHYARQIVKQVKESVGRKVGLDITNTVVRNREELVSQLKSKKMAKVLTKVAEDSSPGKHSITASCSPRLKFLEPRNKPIISSSNVPSSKDHNISQSHNLKATSVSATPQVNIMPQKSKAQTKLKLQEKEWQHRPIKKCKKVCEERFGPPPPPQDRLKKLPQTSDVMIRNKQEEVFVRAATPNNIPDKKSKKTLNITVPTLLPVKKDPTPPATKIPQKPAPNYAQESKRSSQLSSCSSHQSYKQQEVIHTRLNGRGSNNQGRSNGGAATATTTTTTGEYEYITRILRRTGIDKDTPVSFTRWFSPSHPLDPSIFYYLEHFTTTSEKYASAELTLRCNRKLLFHLVDEMLVEILKPYLNMKPWATSCGNYNQLHGYHLIEILCSKVRSFPFADCHVLEDIDALVDKDMPQLKVQSEVAFCEEGEGIVMEIEKDLFDNLIHETALIFYGA